MNTKESWSVALHEAVFLQVKQVLTQAGGELPEVNVLRELVQRIKEQVYPVLTFRDDLEKELYIAHLLAMALERANRDILRLSYRDFRQGVYFPYLLYAVVRLLPVAGRFLHRTIRKVFEECVRKYHWVPQTAVNADLVQSDAFYDFLGNGLKKVDPLTIDDLSAFYRSFFRNILGYHFLRSRDDGRVVRRHGLPEQQPSSRFRLYSRVLNRMETEFFAAESPTLAQVFYNLRIFENILKSNEFQKLYLLVEDHRMGGDDMYRVLAVHRESLRGESALLTQIRSLDGVYQLLRCCRVASTKRTNEHAISHAMLKTVVFEELVLHFKDLVSERYIYEVFDRIAVNFSEAVLGGEYINPLTFSTIRIGSLAFIPQIRVFLHLCLTHLRADPGHDGGRDGKICPYSQRFS